MAPFRKVKEYQNLKVAAYCQNDKSESEIDLFTSDDESDYSDMEEEIEEEFKQDDLEEESDEQLAEKIEQVQQEEPVSTESNWSDD
jgi:hypothetical protein